MLAYRFLRLAGFHTELHFGVDPGGVASDRLRAHCWVVLDGSIVLNPPERAMAEILVVRGGHDVRAMVLYNSFNSWGWLDHCAADVKGKFDVVAGDVRDFQCVAAAMRGRDDTPGFAAAIFAAHGIRNRRFGPDIEFVRLDEEPPDSGGDQQKKDGKACNKDPKMATRFAARAVGHALPRPVDPSGTV